MVDESGLGVKRSVLADFKPWNPHGGWRTNSPKLSSDLHMSAVDLCLSVSVSLSNISKYKKEVSSLEYLERCLFLPISGVSLNVVQKQTTFKILFFLMCVSV